MPPSKMALSSLLDALITFFLRKMTNMAATKTVAAIPAQVRRRMMTAHGLGGVNKVRGMATQAFLSELGMYISSHW